MPVGPDSGRKRPEQRAAKPGGEDRLEEVLSAHQLPWARPAGSREMVILIASI